MNAAIDAAHAARESWGNNSAIMRVLLHIESHRLKHFTARREGMAGKRTLYINGEWVNAKDKSEFPVYNPATGEVWAKVADAARSDASAAIAAASEAQPSWAAMPHSQRARLLSRAGDVLETRQKEFQEALVDEGGAWIGKTMFETGYSAGVYRAAAAAAYRVTGEIRACEHGKGSVGVGGTMGADFVRFPW